MIQKFAKENDVIPSHTTITSLGVMLKKYEDDPPR